MRIFRPCFIAGWIYPEALFRIRTDEKLICLTFDDGPDPVSTPVLLDILARYNIKALFFPDGRAAEKYPELIKMMKSGSHLFGNHGYNHLNGWLTGTEKYVTDVSKADPFVASDLYRPPFGRLSFRQYRILKQRYKIVFWDLMPYDFDTGIDINDSLHILKSKIRPGSVIVLHDTSYSVANRMIDEFITFALKEGYRFELPFTDTDGMQSKM